MKYTPWITTLCCLFSIISVNAQKTTDDVAKVSNKPYWSIGTDLNISTTLQQKINDAFQLSTPRITGLVNWHVHINYDFSERVGVFSGISFSNIGFIEKMKNPDSTVKRRVYALGVPLGFKFGKIKYGTYYTIGGGVDFPFHYKEKGFINRSEKTKYNEWFSERTPRIMPYVFVGAYFRPALSLKLQYYPWNFMNSSYISPSTASSSFNTDNLSMYRVQLLVLSLGIDLNFYPR
jgi:hypothetical protein